MKKLPVIVLLVLLTGCAAPTPVTVEVTKIAVQTVEVTRIVERVITATPVPATPTPMVTPTPEWARYKPQDIIDALNAAGLEAVNPQEMTEFPWGGATDKHGLIFGVPSVCSDCNGRAITFDSPAAFAVTRQYYVGLGEQEKAFFSWVFTRDNALIQINGDMPEAQAKKYEAALNAMK
jgi:hypothetical protein